MTEPQSLRTRSARTLRKRMAKPTADEKSVMSSEQPTLIPIDIAKLPRSS